MSKTRDLTLFEYLEALQLEYINAKLRKKIYPIVKDRNFFERMMGYKKKKIQDIAKRNNLPTIFDSPEIRASYRSKVYGEWGTPDFMYRGEKDIEEFRRWDVINYFAEGSEVKILEEDGSVSVGIIKGNSSVREVFFDGDGEFDQDRSAIIVKCRHDDSERVVLAKRISRIL